MWLLSCKIIMVMLQVSVSANSKQWPVHNYLQNGPEQAVACCLCVPCYMRLKPKKAKGNLGGDLHSDKIILCKALLSVIALVTHE